MYVKHFRAKMQDGLTFFEYVTTKQMKNFVPKCPHVQEYDYGFLTRLPGTACF